MHGVLENCNYIQTWGDTFNAPLEEGLFVGTANDVNGMPCGYFVEYSWDGYGGIYFEILSNIAKSPLTALGSLCLVGLMSALSM